MNRAQAKADEQAESDSVAQLEQQVADLQAQQVQAQVAPPAAAPANDLTSQLAQLAQLQQAGVLSQAEFDAAKAKLLGL
jgi:multidrug resistance efflux pump